MQRAKISVIGGGNVGASCAVWAAEKELGDIVVLDIPEVADVVKGKMLDLAQCGPVDRFDAQIIGTADYKDTAGSDVVIVTAGIPRKPGMSRDDLIQTNVKIVKSVSEQVAKHSPNAVMIIVSNPLDAMVYTAWRSSGFDTNRILGQAGCLDVARFRTFIAWELGVSVEDIQALLLGGHGDDMVPLPRYTSVHGIPVSQLLSQDKIDACVQRAKVGGGEIVKLMGTSAYYAPAAGSIMMCRLLRRRIRRGRLLRGRALRARCRRHGEGHRDRPGRRRAQAHGRVHQPRQGTGRDRQHHVPGTGLRPGLTRFRACRLHFRHEAEHVYAPNGVANLVVVPRDDLEDPVGEPDPGRGPLRRCGKATSRSVLSSHRKMGGGWPVFDPRPSHWR
jgi:malate dehydrogenase